MDDFSRMNFQKIEFGFIGLTAPWALRPHPGSGDSLFFQVRCGSCWCETLEGPRRQVHLREGDIVGISNGLDHVIRDSLDTPIPDQPSEVPELGSELPRSDCVLFVDRVSYEAIFDQFPRITYIRADGSARSQRLAGLIRQLELEWHTAHDEPGSATIIHRLHELIGIEGLRTVVARRDGPATRAIQDPRILRVVGAIYREPQRAWTVDSLARLASMSRSAFAERFRQLVNTSPARYIQRVRLERAGAALRDEDSPLAAVAAAAGYESQSSFHRAFVTYFGVTPGRYRLLFHHDLERRQRIATGSRRS